MVLDDQSLAPYHGSEPYIFISYSHRNSARAAEIISNLNRAGFRVWYDQGLIPGREWDDNIARIIMGCSYFIALLTQEYLASDNCKDELNFARDKDKPLLLIYLDEVALPAGMELRLGRLFAVHKAQYSSNDAFYNKIFAADGLARCNKRYKPAAVPRTSSSASVGRSTSAAHPRTPKPPVSETPRSPASHSPQKKTREPESSGSSGCLLKVIGAILLLAVLAGTIWYLYNNYSSPVPQQPQQTPTPIQTAVPTMSNEAELDIEATPTPVPEAESTPIPEATPVESTVPSPSPTLTPTPTPEPTPIPTPPPTPTPVPTLTPTPTPLPTEETVQIVETTPTPTPTPSDSVVIIESSSGSDPDTVTVITDTTTQGTAH